MTVPLIYASTSGNVEIVAETVSKVLTAQGLDVPLHRAEKTPGTVFDQGQFFILATSTWEHGALNPFFVSLLKEMRSKSFVGKQAVFIGLGDTRYEPVLFCNGIEIVKDCWLKRGGAELHNTLKINGEPYSVLSDQVSAWAEELALVLKK